MSVEPHPALSYIRPDEVAECWDGVSLYPGLYGALWDLVPSYAGPTPEESEEPVVGLNAVTDFWDRLGEGFQHVLNKLAVEQDR